MAKKKKQIADKIRKSRNRKNEPSKTVNPFEVKINPQKHQVLGRKISKHDKGMPGLSRSKATKRRKETLLQEYEQQFKSNKFVDRRFGETDTSLSLDDKMMKRFAMERLKSTDKSSRFNLNEDEELTHYGQSLSQIEKFEDPDVSDEDEEDEDQGRIGAKLVSDEHFGGFMTMKEAMDAADSRSWKERMEDVIAKSKKEKYDRQMEKEKAKQITEQLDEEWTNLRKMMPSFSKGRSSTEDNVQKKADDYDIAVRELQFELKGKATDRMKTEEELAKEEKEKLEKLEADRLRRMRGITEEEITAEKKVHFSADDLDDGFLLDNTDKEKFHVSYKDGKMLGYEKLESADDDDNDNHDDDDIDSDSDQNESDDNEGDKIPEEEKEDESAETGDEEENDKDDELDESDDSYGDIASEDEAEEEEEAERKEVTMTTKKNTTKKTVDIESKKEMMEAARNELPYTFTMPDNYDGLLDLVQQHTVSDQVTIIQRVCKCHHPSLAEGNKTKLESFFTLLVQYYGDLALQESPQLQLMDQLTPILYSLTQQSPVTASQAMIDQISDRQGEFKQICDRRSGRGFYPALDTFLLLKLVSVLFPTSDFYHHVTTPSLLFLCQMLAQCSISYERDVAAGLFVCSLCLEYVSMSKRYIPEAINFLHGVLFLGAEKDPNIIEPVIPPFKPVGKTIDLLLLSKPMHKAEIKKWKVSDLLSTSVEKQALCNDDFRLSAIYNSILLMEEYSKLYEELPSYREIFTPVTDICKKLPVKKYPTSLQEKLKKLTENICTTCQRKRQFLVLQKKKPQALKMFEPKIEEVFEGKRSKQKGTKEFTERQKLIHKHRKEKKGAIREIKKDNQFLARQKLQKQINLDSERKRKVKQIYAMLSTQEGEYKAMKRQKPDTR